MCQKLMEIPMVPLLANGMHVFLHELLHLLGPQRLPLGQLGHSTLHDVLVLLLGDFIPP